MKQEFVTIHGNDWETPDNLFQKIDAEFNFSFDLACSSKNMKTKAGFVYPDVDSLSQKWHNLTGWLWLNPPYSPLKPWIQKSQKECRLGARIVMLIPPIISTRYFSEFLPGEIRFLLGRVPFLLNGVPGKSNTKDSCLLIYDGNQDAQISYWDWRK